MKIIISSSKTMKYQNTTIETAIPKFINKQKQLLKVLKQYDSVALHDILNVSFKISNNVYNYYHQKNPICPAIFFYTGTVFKQLELKRYQADDFEYLNQHVNILSAYYGALKYNDGVSYYRLDMISKLDQLNLYDYWSNDIKNYFKNEDMIISLASKEFTKMVKHPNIIEIDFIENISGDFTRKVMYIKMARGRMLNYMVKNNITTLDELKLITFDGYKYDENISTNNKLAFVRDATKVYRRL